MSAEQLPLPYGWVQEFDPNTNHPFWVDTNADPPRAIWTHPYEDEQYLREHPEVREKVGSLAQQQGSNDPSGSKPARRHSFNGRDSTSMVPDEHPTSPDASQKGKEKRGFFGKLKDKAIGTKEEREAYKKEQARIESERRRQHAELIRAQRARYAQEQARFAQQQAMYNQGQYPAGPYQRRYGPPPGNPYGGYGPGYGTGYGYGYPSPRQGRSSNAVPILGALAGGLLLGDLLGGGF
ncbi:hypothetical protein EDB92DRAFT_1893789 [Lactarius akahatsu]|uniref:WW domain-containing protein n=1 Tax=Lactarius akahatsu TaxID=416441 RepID=A0AAD4L8J1_9AGAM|nr:hypothetical protein EDB92DRAFT_1893789 [Lactarius akahatsu]